MDVLGSFLGEFQEVIINNNTNTSDLFANNYILVLPEPDPTDIQMKKEPKLLLHYVNKTVLNGNFVIFFLLVTLVSAMITVLFLPTSSTEYFSKDYATKIEKVIKNGGDLETIQHIYRQRTFVKVNLFTKSTNDKLYTNATSIVDIFYDIKSQHFASGSIDTPFMNRLNNLIVLQNQRDPFDKLTEGQKTAFENVRFKLDSNYSLVQEDMNSISEEMNDKNQLVESYLGKSNTSYIISLIALALSLLFSIYQIIIDRRIIKTPKTKDNLL